MIHPTAQKKQKAYTAKNSLRRAMWLIIGFQIFLFTMALFFILDGSPVSLLPEQASILGDLFMIVLILCPLMLCAFPFYLLLGASIFGIIRLDISATYRLRKLQFFSKSTQTRTEKLAQTLSKGSIEVNSRAEFLRPILRLFDQPKDDDNDGKQRKLEE